MLGADKEMPGNGNRCVAQWMGGGAMRARFVPRAACHWPAFALALLLLAGLWPLRPAADAVPLATPAPDALGSGASAPAPVQYGYRVLRSFPHDPQAFTQGLLFWDGRLFESIGGYGRSALREVELHSGRVLREHPLPAQLFGEGLALAEGRFIQLTWRAGLGLLYDVQTLAPAGQFRYPGEGWGLTGDGERLWQSDGSAELRLLDPRTLEETGRLKVHDGNRPVSALNELEFVEGQIYANVWGTDRIAMIDPASGRVRGWLNLAGILPLPLQARADVLNGIAYDQDARRLFVTGKRWPRLFQIELAAP